MTVSRKKVEAALRAEGRKLDAKNRGCHTFTEIWKRPDVSGCNWSANFRATGSSLPLDDMQDALERVQARFPVVEFE